ncbi:voltage-gated potassium channel KCNC1-like isoform X2 [Clytia hemisphaerica]
MMEPCCWGTYTQHRDAHKNLSMFDDIHAQGNADDDYDNEAEDIEILMTSAPGRHKSKPYQQTVDHKSLWSQWLAFRPRLWAILEKPFSSVYAQVSAFISLVIILMSLTTFCAETVKYFEEEKHIFGQLEYFYCAFFTLELLLRLWCCPSKKKYFKSAMTWIDIISTAQFYISFIADTHAFDVLFVTRLLRVFRLFRFFKNLSGMQVIAQTLKASANELLLLCIIVFIPMVIFSTCVFYAEQGQNNTKFPSIPETFWWAIITMTTVGYGDVTPDTLAGRIIGGLTACSGVLIVALPVSVIGSNFSLYYSYAQARMRLPKRKSPALVSADKALIPNASSTKLPDGGGEWDNKGSIAPSLQSVGTLVLNTTGFERTPLTSPVPTPDPTRMLKRERSGIRRHAIQPSANPINSPIITPDGKPSKSSKTKGRRARKVSKAVKGKISEEQPDGPEVPTSDSPEESRLSRCHKRSSLPIINNNNEKVDGLCNGHDQHRNSPEENSDEDISASLHRKMTRVPRTRSLSEHRSPRIRNVIHGDQLMNYVPKKLSASEQKRRRKLTYVPNFHSSPTEDMTIDSMTEGSNNNTTERITPTPTPPWMARAAYERSLISPPLMEESVILMESVR